MVDKVGYLVIEVIVFCSFKNFSELIDFLHGFIHCSMIFDIILQNPGFYDTYLAIILLFCNIYIGQIRFDNIELLLIDSKIFQSVFYGFKLFL